MVDAAVVQNLLGILNAYVRRFNPDMKEEDLPGTVEAIVPLISDGDVTKADVLALVQQVTARFNRSLARSQRIQPEALRKARELLLCLAQKPMEEAVKETVMAYVKRYEPALEAVSENLIESALAAIVQGQIEFNWETELNLEDKQLLIKQVAFKLNVMQADPLPSKAAEEIAAQIRNEVDRFREEQAALLGQVNASGAVVEPDQLTVSSPWLRPLPKD
jgi:hypothetical protein